MKEQYEIDCYRDLLLTAHSIEKEKEDIRDLCIETKKQQELEAITQEQLEAIHNVLMIRFVVVK